MTGITQPLFSYIPKDDHPYYDTPYNLINYELNFGKYKTNANTYQVLSSMCDLNEYLIHLRSDVVYLWNSSHA